MKILTIFTGGTIGSKEVDGWIELETKTKDLLLNSLKNKDDIIFDTTTPYMIQSETLSNRELNLLQDAVLGALGKDYDGILITHGTDTLHFSAAALEYSLPESHIPIVFVSSDYPLCEKRANGYQNFEAAIEFLKEYRGSGVFVSYKNHAENTVNIHIPTRMLQYRECSANIYSIDNEPFATYNEKITFNNINLCKNNTLGKVNYSKDSKILVIDSRPGDSYSYNLENIKAVILKPYHSATLDTENEDLRKFSKAAKEKNIPIFIVNDKNKTVYESTKKYDDLNIIRLPYSTYVSAYMKIWAGVSLNKDIKEFMKIPIANEIK